MNKMIKMATIVAGVGAMLSFAGCGGDSVNGDSDGGDSARNAALTKVQGLTPGYKWSFVSEKMTGDKSEVVLKASVDGQTEDSKVSCVKKDGKWVVTHLDGKAVD